MPPSLTEATTSLHGILEPLSSEDRRRVIQAALVLLGDIPPALGAKPIQQPLDEPEPSGLLPALPPQAKAWMTKHKVSAGSIEAFIHLDNGKATVIESPATKGSGREKTHAAYLMAGLASLFENGEPSVNDDVARALCVHFGCYDANNHSAYVKALGNSVAGSKSAGWKLTAPGLTAVAELIKGAHAGD
jgi:hypothetical protein